MHLVDDGFITIIQMQLLVDSHTDMVMIPTTYRILLVHIHVLMGKLSLALVIL
jgi:hypothetical protein